MKRAIIPSVIGSCALGFLAGRLTAPSSHVEGGSTSIPNGRVNHANATESSRESMLERTSRPQSTTATSPTDDAESQARNLADREKFVSRCRRKFDSLIQEWTKELHLTSSQVTALLSERDGSLSKIESGWGNGGLDASEELGELVEGGGLESKLDDVLNANQRDTFESWKGERENQRRQSTAISALASIQLAVRMSSEQRQKVMDRLFDLSLQNGVNLVPPAPGQPDTAFMQELGTRLASGSDPAKAASELARERIDKQCDALAGVLDAAQLEDYRAYLENLQQSWLIPEDSADQ